jgi:hypothetical protein
MTEDRVRHLWSRTTRCWACSPSGDLVKVISDQEHTIMAQNYITGKYPA